MKTDKGVRETVAEQEEGNWRKEFGEEIALLLSDVVNTTMEDYLYMRERATKLD